MKAITTNRAARRNYEILDQYEAGIVLTGSEVKSLRAGNANLKDSFVHIRRGEAFLVNAHIAPYPMARDGGHEPERPRKLLLHKREIERLGSKLAEQGLSLIPLQMYWKDGRAKVELGLGKGRRAYDKRQAIKKRDQDREVERALRQQNR